MADDIVCPWENSITDVIYQLLQSHLESSFKNVDELSIVKSDYASLGRFADHDDPFDALVVTNYPDTHACYCLNRRFPPGTTQPQVYLIGQRKLVVVVNRGNRIAQLTTAQVDALLAAQEKPPSWDVVGGGHLPVMAYDQGPGSWERELLRKKCMGYSEKHPGYISYGFHSFRKDIQPLADGEAIIAKVRSQTNAIGFFLYQGQNLSGVKVLNVVADGQKQAVALSLTPRIQPDYLLSEPLMLYVHPKAPEIFRDFGRFAVSPTGAKIAAEHGLITPYAQWSYEADQRVNQMHAGQGPRLFSVGLTDFHDLMPDLTVEQTRANEPIQLNFAPTASDVPAMGIFVQSAGVQRDLLFLSGRPSDRALELHGNQWNQLQPQEHLLAGRATAIVVNAANHLDSLTLGQIQAIFRGEVNDWAIVGGSGLTPPPAADATHSGGRGVPIDRFGLGSQEPAAQAFYKDGVPAADLRRVTYVKDTAEALARVSVDRQAIAFVDLAAIPATGQTVKVLGIQIGMGDHARIVKPTPQDMRDAMYPFTQRIYMYVHPKASEAAKRFAKFLATCGQSAEKPYTDTVKDVMAVYQKHGLIPLAEPAIQRMLKDAQDQLAANAKASAAASPR